MRTSRWRRLPKWTIQYAVKVQITPWAGKGWEFFDHKRDAQTRLKELEGFGDYRAELRPFHISDVEHLMISFQDHEGG